MAMTLWAFRAPGAHTVTTNVQVLENIAVQLKFIEQGMLGSRSNALNINTMSFNTSDLIQQLDDMMVPPGTFSKRQKLVLSILYSNYLTGVPNTATITAVQTNGPILAGTNIGVISSTGGTNALSITNATQTNAYLISNNVVYQNVNIGLGVQPTATNALTGTIGTISNGTILLGGGASWNVATTFNTNGQIPVPGGPPIGTWMTLVPTIAGGQLNLIITQFSPQTNIVFTNAAKNICVYTPASGSTPASLINVDNWISAAPNNQLNNQATFSFYKEGGSALSGVDFSGTNIVTQTVTSYENVRVDIAYPTNVSVPATQTNIIFAGDNETGPTNSDTYLNGIGVATTKLVDLTVGGTPRQKAVFQVVGSETITVAGDGYIGGTFTTNSLQTNLVDGILVTNGTLPASSYLGTNRVSFHVTDYVPAIGEGTITITYLTALSSNQLLLPMPP
jgi:hypothetical protein